MPAFASAHHRLRMNVLQNAKSRRRLRMNAKSRRRLRMNACVCVCPSPPAHECLRLPSPPACVACHRRLSSTCTTGLASSHGSVNRELRELSAGFDSAHAAGAVPGSAVHAGSCSMFTGVRFHAIPSESLRGCKALKTFRFVKSGRLLWL